MPLPRPLHKPCEPTIEANGTSTETSTESDSAIEARAWLTEIFDALVQPMLSLMLRPRPRLGLRLVLISDTHGCHRRLTLPAGDVLIHAGDFTNMGHLPDAKDFNEWLGEQTFTHKLCVFGNHECNSEWNKDGAVILSNGTLLTDSAVTIHVKPAGSEAVVPLCVHGTNFYWPSTLVCKSVRS